MRRSLRVGIALITFLVPQAAIAVPPPDFLFAAGSQLVQAFSLTLLVLSAALASVKQYAVLLVNRFRHPQVALAGVLVLVVIASLGIALSYDRWQQQRQVQQFTDELADPDAVPPDLSSLDTLTTDPESITLPLASASDAGSQFIRTYYGNIGSGNLAEAYETSLKAVPYETFASWYATTTAVTVDYLRKIDDTRYSLRLTLTDASGQTMYAVVMTLSDTTPLRVASSQVRVLAFTPPLRASVTPEPTPGYFQSNDATTPLMATNADLQAVLDHGAYVLDAREDEEYELGYIPGSTHIRFADLVAGLWVQLPTDRTVYVVCWSGIRGKEVASFLRTKGVVARYMEKGVTGWEESGGAFVGQTSFLSRYTAERYKVVFTTEQVRHYLTEGVVLVDSRAPETHAAWHPPGSIGIPIIYVPTSAFDEVFGAIPPGSRVITLCDGWVSCFDAKITGVKVEQRGHTFLGRFTRVTELR